MILIIDFGSNKTTYIEQIIDEIIDVRNCRFTDFKQEALVDIQGVVLSGAPILVTEVDMEPYMKLMKWIKTTSVPVLGICFGHQLIGLIFEAFASKMKEERDWQTVETFEDCPLFNRLPNEIEMMKDHCETISVPAGFELVAASDKCVNEAMQHSEKPIFGVQFHPEVSGNHGRVVLENFVTICAQSAQKTSIH